MGRLLSQEGSDKVGAGIQRGKREKAEAKENNLAEQIEAKKGQGAKQGLNQS